MTRCAGAISADTKRGDSAGALSDKGDLRRENEHLRQRLRGAEEIATHYTMMLREGDHRIKNSLQIVSSLMALQAMREPSASARDALNAAASRIQSVARIHDALQAGEGRDVVDLGEILGKMCASLYAMAGDPLRVAVRVAVEPVQMPAKRAQPIVLAVNELVVNALRHAFPDGRVGSIDVSVTHAGDDLRIVVSDDGKGLPADYAAGGGYGMKLVGMMAGQVGGALDIDTSAGSRFSLIVPSPLLAAADISRDEDPARDAK